MALSRRWIWILLIAAMVVLSVLGFFGSFYAPLLGDIGTKAHYYLTLPLFSLGHIPVTFVFLVKVALFVVSMGLIAHFALRLLQKRILVHTPLALPQQYAVAKVGSYFIFLIGLVVGLESIGLNLESLVVVGGALGLGVGLGLQSVVANFVAGLILLFEQPIRIGDRIEVGSTMGDVVDIRGRSTWVRTNDNIVIIVPNSDFITNRLTNWTVNDRQVRIGVPVGVGYNSDPEQVRAILLSVGRAHPEVLADPAPDVIFNDLGDNALNFVLRVWTTTQLHRTVVLKSDLYFALFRALREAGVEMPFPQRDIHLRSVDGAAMAALRGGPPEEPS